MILGHTCIFHIGFYVVFFSANQQKTVTLLHSAQRKCAFLVKTKEVKITNSQKESFSVIIASDIGTQVHKVTIGWKH